MSGPLIRPFNAGLERWELIALMAASIGLTLGKSVAISLANDLLDAVLEDKRSTAGCFPGLPKDAP